MTEQRPGDDTLRDPEHNQGELPARRRAREQLAAIAAQCPGHRVTIEIFPGREDRYVAQAVTASAKPYLVITTDLNELSAELGGAAEQIQVTPLPRRAPGTAWTPPHSI